MENKKITILSNELIRETREILLSKSLIRTDGLNFVEGIKIKISSGEKINLCMIPFRIRIGDLEEGETKEEKTIGTYLKYINELNDYRTFLSVYDIKFILDHFNNLDSINTNNKSNELFSKAKYELDNLFKLATQKQINMEEYLRHKYYYSEKREGGLVRSFDSLNEIVDEMKCYGIDINEETLATLY